VRATRDEAGRISTLTNSSGKSRHFSYDARGSLVGYTDARGRRRTFAYDHRGRLRSVADAEGVSLKFDYDRGGHLIAVRPAEAAKDGAQFLRTSFIPLNLFARTLVQGRYGCMFGGDGWFEGDTYNGDFGTGCDDPIGGFGGSSEDGGWGISNPNDPGWRGNVMTAKNGS
jgi:YD repeat-containing protein